MQVSTKLLSASALALVLSSPASAANVVVDAQASIFGAGLATLPDAAGGAGVLPPSVTVSGGQTVTITATGSTNPGGGYGDHGPAGFGTASNIVNVTGSSIGNYAAPTAMTLLGVFTGSGSGVNTIFQIGSGGTFTAPGGATKLYLGFADAYGFQGNSGWYADNSGSILADVTLSGGGIPEPATWALMILGFGAVAGAMRRRPATRIRFA